MPNTNPTTTAPIFNFNGYPIESTYTFSEYSKAPNGKKSGKVWLDMVFKHPVKEEAVTVRAAKSALILGQPEEVIGAIAQREIRDFLSFSSFSLNTHFSTKN